MPSHRRRPQVAGLRRPGGQPSPRPRPTPYSAQQEDVHTDEHTDDHAADELIADGTQAPADFDEPAAPPEPEAPEEVDEVLEEQEVAELPARPSPRAKTRDTGKLKPTTEAAVAEAGETSAEPEPDLWAPPPGVAATGRRRDTVPFWIAVGLAVVFAAGAALAAWQYLATEEPTENRAHVDSVATDQVSREIATAVETLFSYDYTKLDGRADAVDGVLASGKLKDQFATLNCAVLEEAPKQKIVTLTRATAVAITELTADKAQAVVFVDNVWERKSTKQRQPGAASLGVTAVQVGGEWKLQSIKIHGGKAGKDPKVPEKCK